MPDSIFAHRTHCQRCGRRELDWRLVPVQVARQTHSSPAEHDYICSRCVQAAYAGMDDDDYERAAVRARLTDFVRTGGKDWS
jgi:ribosomal protein L37E